MEDLGQNLDQQRQQIVAQTLNQMYHQKSMCTYKETIKGAVDREIKRNEEQKQRSNQDVSERIQFNPSASYDRDMDSQNSVMMIDQKPLSIIYNNDPEMYQMTELQQNTQLTPTHLNEYVRQDDEESFDSQTKDQGEGSNENINFGVRDSPDQNENIMKFVDEKQFQSSDDESSGGAVNGERSIISQIQAAVVEIKDGSEEEKAVEEEKAMLSPVSQVLSKSSRHDQILASMAKTFGAEVSKQSNNQASKLQMKKKMRELKKDVDNQDPEEVKKFYQEQLIRKMKEESELSLRALKDHVRQNHSKKNNEEWWPIFISLGSFFAFNKEFALTQQLRDIGLGPALYLLTLNALGKMFLILTILNLPCMYFFYSGSEHLNKELNIAQRLFASISLGNLGQTGGQCQEMNLAKNKKSFTLSCPSGTLDRLDSFGLSSKMNQYCDSRHLRHSFGKVYEDGRTIVQSTEFPSSQRESNAKYFSNFMLYDKKCSSYNKEESKFKKDLEKNFKIYCKDQQSCIIDFNYEDLNSECTDLINYRIKYSKFYNRNETEKHLHPYDNDILEPNIFVVSSCKNVGLRLRGTNHFMTKHTISTYIVIVDIISMIFVLCFINILQHLQKDFCDLFDDNTIEIRDYSVKIDILPSSYKTCEDEIEVKFKLWRHIQDIIEDAKEANICSKDLDSHIVDIQFGMRNYSALKDLKKLQSKCHQVEDEAYRMRKTKKNRDKLKHMRHFEQNQESLKVYLEQYIKKHGNKSFATSLQNKQYDSVYDEIQVIYIIFLSMETKDLIFEKLMPENGKLNPILQKFYQDRQKKQKGSANIMSKLAMLNQVKDENPTKNLGQSSSGPPVLALQDFMKNSQKFEGGNFELEKKKTMSANEMTKAIQGSLGSNLDREKDRLANIIKTTQPVDPEFILWDNIGYSNLSRNLRKSLSILIAFTIIGCSFFVVMESNNYRYQLMVEQPSIKCDITPTKFQAYQDIKLPKDMRHNYMSCFCYHELLSNYKHFFRIDFTEFGDHKDGKFCISWLKGYTYANLYYRFSFLIVVLINLIAQEIFIIVARNEKQIYSATENQSIFEYIFYQSFINIGIILIFTDVNAKFLQYGEFDTFWYIEIGSQLCFTMLIQNYTSKGGDLFRILWELLKRLWDRGLQSTMNKKGEDEDTPNTSKLRQQELENLYTGPQIKIGYKMSYTFTYIFIGLSYSSGLPIMYPACVLYFLMTYWFDKICILRFYQRSQDFNEELPMKSVNLMKYAVLLHFIFSFFIYSSSPLHDFYIERPNFSQEPIAQGILKKEKTFFTDYIILFLIFVCISIVGYFINYKMDNCFQKNLHSLWHYFSSPKSEFDTEQQNQDGHGSKENIVSLNFYGEILFDYLLAHYENTIYYIGNLEHKFKQFKIKYLAKQNEVKRFQQYLDATKMKLKLMEKQIDFYYEFLIRKIKEGDSAFSHMSTNQITEILELNPIKKGSMQKSNNNTLQDNHKSSLMYGSPDLSHQFSESDEGVETQINNLLGEQSEANVSMNTNQKMFLEKLEFLDSYFDEDGIHQEHLQENLRCATFLQSYNILDNPYFQEADGAYDRAVLLTSSNFFIEDIEYDSSSDDSSSQASDEKSSTEESQPECSSQSSSCVSNIIYDNEIEANNNNNRA